MKRVSAKPTDHEGAQSPQQGTRGALSRFVACGFAILAAKQDELEVAFHPFIGREEPAEVAFHAVGGLCGRPAPSAAKPQNVRIDGECGNTECV